MLLSIPDEYRDAYSAQHFSVSDAATVFSAASAAVSSKLKS